MKRIALTTLVAGVLLAPVERKKIDHMQDRLSGQIYRQKHDGQSRVR